MIFDNAGASPIVPKLPLHKYKPRESYFNASFQKDKTEKKKPTKEKDGKRKKK